MINITVSLEELGLIIRALREDSLRFSENHERRIKLERLILRLENNEDARIQRAYST